MSLKSRRRPAAAPLGARLVKGVLWLTLNRPDKRNALSAKMIAALRVALERADLDAAVRAVVLRGAGKDFCAGADLRELLDSSTSTPGENERDAMQLGQVFLAIRRLPKPVVALVHGRALAGGCGLATACDLILAHADAQFGYPEIRRGFVPAMVMTMLRRAVGAKIAFELVSTGRLLSAREAQQIGLVARVYASDTFAAEAAAMLQELASSSGTALALIKQQLNQLEELPFEEGVRLGAQVNAVARSTPEFRQAVQAFLAKR